MKNSFIIFELYRISLVYKKSSNKNIYSVLFMTNMFLFWTIAFHILQTVSEPTMINFVEFIFYFVIASSLHRLREQIELKRFC